MVDASSPAVQHLPMARLLVFVICASALALGCKKTGPSVDAMKDSISAPTLLPALLEQPLGGVRELRVDVALALPAELHEISGLTLAPDGRVVAVQDEAGALFFIDIDTVRNGAAPGRIERVQFGEPGDYEGVTCAGGVFFVLRSDGVLFELETHEDRLRIAADWALKPSPHAEYEGLCYDATRGVLLVAAKGRPLGKDGDKQKRHIYGFDLESRSWMPDPVRTLDRKRIIDDDGPASDELPQRTTKKGKRKVDFDMQLSGVALHPTSAYLCLLSGPDRTLFLVDADGKLTRAYTFQADELPRPEGVSFLSDGTLLLSSEGAECAAVLLVIDGDP